MPQPCPDRHPGSVENRRSGFTLTARRASNRRASLDYYYSFSFSDHRENVGYFYLFPVLRSVRSRSRRRSLSFVRLFDNDASYDARATFRRDRTRARSFGKKKSDSRLNPFPVGASSPTFLRSSIMRARDSNPIFYFATRLHPRFVRTRQKTWKEALTDALSLGRSACPSYYGKRAS